MTHPAKMVDLKFKTQCLEPVGLEILEHILGLLAISKNLVTVRD
jgi:hypothetical protein